MPQDAPAFPSDDEFQRVKKIIICVNARSNPSQPSCAMRGSREIFSLVSNEVRQRKWPIQVEEFYCLGFCEHGPNAKLVPDGPMLKRLNVEDLPALLDEIEAFISKQGDCS
jgi:NADH:ubiquinone oxidoreductase subunit E